VRDAPPLGLVIDDIGPAAPTQPVSLANAPRAAHGGCDPDGRARTRMQSKLPKVLHPLAGLPMIEHVVRAAVATEPGQLPAHIGPNRKAARAYFAPPHPLADRLTFAWQAARAARGTRRRWRCAPAADIEWVIVIFGDHPLWCRNIAGAHGRGQEGQPIAALVLCGSMRWCRMAAIAGVTSASSVSSRRMTIRRPITSRS